MRPERAIALALAACALAVVGAPAQERAPEPINIYAQIGTANVNWATVAALPRVYVPNHSGNSVSVIDPATLKEVARFRVGSRPQHVVPSWDMRTLWVANDAPRRGGSVTPIDPKTGAPGSPIPVDDPYNMYFMPDGSAAIVVDEALKRLDLRDPHSMQLRSSIATPTCHGVNHADFAADGSYAVFTCEFSGGGLIKVDLIHQEVVGELQFSRKGMPQDIRLSPDGTTFYVADMMNDGVFLVDADSFKETGFIATGPGAHGFVVSRDGTKLYVSNRGSHLMRGRPHGPGSVSVIDFATKTVTATWPIPGGGSPDMGNVSADGRQLWLSGRFDNEVYAIDTTSGAVTRIPVGAEPHGLTVWPQPGRYSLGHTGNMR